MIGDKQRLSFLWNMTTFRNKPGPAGPPGLPIPLWNGQIQAWDTEAYRIAHDYTISVEHGEPLLLVQEFVPQGQLLRRHRQDWKDKVCMKDVVDCNVNFPNIGFTEFTGWNSTAYNGTEQPGWGMKDDLSYIRGSHTMKFGFSLPGPERRTASASRTSPAARTSAFRAPAFRVARRSRPAAAMPSHRSCSAMRFSAAPKRFALVNQNYPYYGFYAQDDWRITRKLTLNYGLRYEFTLPPTSGTDEYSDFDPTRPNPGADGYPGALDVRRFRTRPREHAITGSRLVRWHGVRASVSPTRRTTRRTIRAAFGRSFSRVTAVQGSGHFAGFIGQYQFDNTNQRHHADVQLGPGTAGLHAAALHRPGVLERQQRRLVAGSGSCRALRRICSGRSRCSARWRPTPCRESRTTPTSARTCKPGC